MVEYPFPVPIKALTLTQPWATLAVGGCKLIETRSWPTHEHRGPLAIHSSRNFPDWARAVCYEEPFSSTLRALGITHPELLILGKILGTVELIDCVPITADAVLPEPDSREFAFGDFSPGRYMWLLDGARTLAEPLNARGHPGLWVYPKRRGPSTKFVETTP